MGNVISRAKLLVGAVYLINQTLDSLDKRLKKSPGLPVPNPSLPFWTVPKSSIAAIQQPLPDHADIVVVGSGITAASFVYNVLEADSALRVVVLEAREVCSGATGRNGGHINAPLWQDWIETKEQHGEKDARMLINFRLAHIKEMQAVASKEDILKESQVRETEHLEVHLDKDTFEETCEGLAAWKADMPEVAGDYEAVASAEAQAKYGITEGAAGVVVGPGGAMHPYRFVTNLFAKLLERYSDRFSIASHTPCISIQAPTASTPYYTVRTPSGNVLAAHVVHATNGWVSHLVEPMRTKVVPTRGTMSAQRPGTALGRTTHDGQRSYVFYPGGLGYDYLTQLPAGEHELMFGGGWAAAALASALAELGRADDAAFSLPGAAHLAGALPLYFARDAWGREKVPEDDEASGGVRWPEGRTKAVWGGILGISADGLPWVGRLPHKLAGRAPPPASSAPRAPHKETGEARATTAAPGEWISAGYTGEGMVHAWMCGKALASMVLDKEDAIQDWFPETLRITEARWKKANLEEFISHKMSG